MDSWIGRTRVKSLGWLTSELDWRDAGTMVASASAKDKGELSLHRQGTQCPPPGRALSVLGPKARSGVWPPGKQAIYDPGSAPAFVPWTAPLLALPWKSWVVFNSSLWHCARHRKMLERLLVCRTAHTRGAEGHGDISSPSPLPWVVARAPPVWKQQGIRGPRWVGLVGRQCGSLLCTLHPSAPADASMAR